MSGRKRQMTERKGNLQAFGNIGSKQDRKCRNTRKNISGEGENYPSDYKTKLKESEKRDKYVDLARDLKKQIQKKKKQWNIKATVIPILIGAL